jgi:FixJ family two-component response regulator
VTARVVHLVDDNEPFRRSTAWLLETAGFTVHDYPGARAFLEAAATLDDEPCCLVSDIRMPDMSGLELHEELRKRGSRLPIVFITAHGDIPLAVEAIRKGASDFIEKPFQDNKLIAAIEGALAGRGNGDAASQSREKLARLTPREVQVLDLVVSGKLNKTIADELHISIKTVELHRANMMSKLGVHNVPDLVRLVLGVRQ